MNHTFTDSAFPDIQKVGAKLFALGECSKYVSSNYQALEQQLKAKFNFPKEKWQLDIEAAGGKIATAMEVNEDLKPRAWKIVRVVGLTNGHLRLDIERPHRDGSKHMQKMSVMTSDLDGAFVASFDDYLSERLQSTVDRILDQKKRILEKRASDKRAKEESDLAKAKALLRRDADLPDFQRAALHKDSLYAASIENASKLINSQAKPKKVSTSAMVQANKRLYAQGCVKSAEQTVESRKRILETRTRMGKQDAISEAQCELKKAQDKLAEAKSNLSTFQC